MEEASASVPATQDVQRMGRSYSARSLSAFSVDENVLDLLWDEEVHMEELLEFSFDHVDKLAQRRGKTVTAMEKLRLWDYIQQMRLEEPDWVTPETVPWEELEARYALPSGALPEEASAKDLLFYHSSPVSTSVSPLPSWTPRHQLKSPTVAEVATHRSKLFPGPLSPPAERFSLSEEWNTGSRREHVASASSGGRWRRRWRRLLGTVFHPASAKDTRGYSGPRADLGTIATGGAAPSEAFPDHGFQPPAPTTFPKQRPGGFLRRSLRRMAIGTKRRRDLTSHPETENP